MRRILLLLTGALALALAAPAVASAHHGRHHHRHHHRHQAQHARVRHFGGSANTDPSNPGTPGDAGRVASFTDGTLTITLADGSSVSGKVTNDTVVNCIPAVQNQAPTAATAHDGGGWGGDQGDDDQGDQGDHHGGCQGQSACTTADLVPGAVVHEAILKLGADGAEFKLVLLVKQQQATS